MFKRLGWLALTFLLMLPVSQAAFADTTSSESIPGGLSLTCPGNLTPCFIGNSQLTVVRDTVANNTTSVAINTKYTSLVGVELQNNSATIAYLKLYNAAQGSVTCGSGTPVDTLMIPVSTAIYIPVGTAYTTALTACVTTGFADADTTAPAASAYRISFYFR